MARPRPAPSEGASTRVRKRALAAVGQKQKLYVFLLQPLKKSLGSTWLPVNHAVHVADESPSSCVRSLIGAVLLFSIFNLLLVRVNYIITYNPLRYAKFTRSRVIRFKDGRRSPDVPLFSRDPAHPPPEEPLEFLPHLLRGWPSPSHRAAPVPDEVAQGASSILSSVLRRAPSARALLPTPPSRCRSIPARSCPARRSRSLAKTSQTALSPCTTKTLRGRVKRFIHSIRPSLSACP